MDMIKGIKTKEIHDIINEGCPNCGEHDDPKNHMLLFSGVQHCSGSGVKASGDCISMNLEDTDLITPIFIWCEGCKTVLLDDRISVSISVMSMDPPKPTCAKRGQQVVFLQTPNSPGEYGFVERDTAGPTVVCRFWQGNSNILRNKANGETVNLDDLVLMNFKPQEIVDEMLESL